MSWLRKPHQRQNRTVRIDCLLKTDPHINITTLLWMSFFFVFYFTLASCVSGSLSLCLYCIHAELFVGWSVHVWSLPCVWNLFWCYLLVLASKSVSVRVCMCVPCAATNNNEHWMLYRCVKTECNTVKRNVDCINQQWIEHSMCGFQQHQFTLNLILFIKRQSFERLQNLMAWKKEKWMYVLIIIIVICCLHDRFYAHDLIWQRRCIEAKVMISRCQFVMWECSFRSIGRSILSISILKWNVRALCRINNICRFADK